MAGWLAHQVNNPLGAISGNAQLLARRLARDIGEGDALQTYLRYIDAIQSQVERCTRITDELLEFMRPRELDIRTVEVSAAIAEAVELATYERGQGLGISVRAADGTARLVQTDRELLVRVLYEVILNAIQAVSEDGLVEIDAAADASERVRVTVADSGPGIPEEILPRIFEPFFSTREKARGMGLTVGLAIMRQLGGSIEVSRSGPQGTAVSILVPADLHHEHKCCDV